MLPRFTPVADDNMFLKTKVTSTTDFDFLHNNNTSAMSYSSVYVVCRKSVAEELIVIEWSGR